MIYEWCMIMHSSIRILLKQQLRGQRALPCLVWEQEQWSVWYTLRLLFLLLHSKKMEVDSKMQWMKLVGPLLMIPWHIYTLSILFIRSVPKFCFTNLFERIWIHSYPWSHISYQGCIVSNFAKLRKLHTWWVDRNHLVFKSQDWVCLLSCLTIYIMLCQLKYLVSFFLFLTF